MRYRHACTALLAASILLLGSSDAHAQRTRTRQGPHGGTARATRQIQNTGGGTYQRNADRSWASPNGKSGSLSSSGQGQVSGGKGQGVTNTYQGQVTTGQGNTYSVDHSADYNYDQATGVTRDGSTSVTNSSGQVVGTSTSGSSAQAGQGHQRSTTTTSPNGSSTTNVSNTYDEATGRTRTVDRDDNP